jgi:hypothetical protein
MQYKGIKSRRFVRRKPPHCGLTSEFTTMALSLEPLRVLEFLAKKSITKMDHPPRSPDLTPEMFYSFKN